MKKVSFDELKNTLTRTEMKSIMAGSGSGGDCNPPCSSSAFGCCCGGGKVICATTISQCEAFCGN